MQPGHPRAQRIRERTRTTKVHTTGSVRGGQSVGNERRPAPAGRASRERRRVLTEGATVCPLKGRWSHPSMGTSVPAEEVAVAPAEGALVAPAEGALVAPRRRGCLFQPKGWRSHPSSRVTRGGRRRRSPRDRGHLHREGRRREDRFQAAVVDAPGGLTSGSRAKRAGIQHRRGEMSGLVAERPLQPGCLSHQRGTAPSPPQTPQVTSSGRVIHRFQKPLPSRFAAWWDRCIRTSVLRLGWEAP
jgi:hypothetical protein